MASQLKPKITANNAFFSIPLSSRPFEAVQGAAYLMTDKAYVVLGGDRKKALTVELAPKPASGITVKELADRFSAELESQVLRWAVAKHNQPIREHVIEQAVLQANGRLEPQPAAPAADALSDEQRQEIDRLIAEVEDEIKAINQKKAVPDPKNIKASWEEKQQPR